MPTAATRRIALTALIVWSVTILGLCLWPHPTLRGLPPISHFDKIVHAVIFFVEGALLRASGFRLRGIVAFGLALAIGTELLQFSLPSLGRTGEVADAVADLFGLTVGALVAKAWLRTRTAG